MFATELTKPIESFLTRIRETVGIDRHSYQLVASDCDSALKIKYEVLPYNPNSLDRQPSAANVLSLQYVNTLTRQWSGEANAYPHLFRLVSTSSDLEQCQNNRDFGATVIERGIKEGEIVWANYTPTGTFGLVTRVPPTRDARNNYVCSTSFVIGLGGRIEDCSC